MPAYSFPYAMMKYTIRSGSDLSDEVFVCMNFMELLGLMLAPSQDEEDVRKSFSSAYEAAILPDVQADGDIEVLIDSRTTKLLRNAPDYRTITNDIMGERLHHGYIAGYICGWCVTRSLFPHTAAQASLGAAMRMIDDATKLTGRSGARNAGGGIENVKKNVWPKYRPVAHLWAALVMERIFDSETSDNEISRLESIFMGDPISIEYFVALSQYFLQVGSTIKPKGARDGDTILRQNEAWSFLASDDGYRLPDIKVVPKDDIGLDLFDARKTWGPVR